MSYIAVLTLVWLMVWVLQDRSEPEPPPEPDPDYQVYLAWKRHRDAQREYEASKRDLERYR